ncbi:hypothetical protein I2494_13320 [Budviciaceae bacterium BWR-B9]|uniref:Uncharacterized protein n=1 Tax=Limnobaculum allomyrinae TaxID=2791986 RepID=A0ABS1ISF3_9GAMM|nr:MULTISPECIES: hypothetical protein [Limnobaculum]MBK5144682.1 hypothetical protein [Limnobaculum allomyrinae]MBV7692344.1 hypothetical protein [Limnobaculum sp. M2-1]
MSNDINAIVLRLKAGAEINMSQSLIVPNVEIIAVCAALEAAQKRNAEQHIQLAAQSVPVVPDEMTFHDAVSFTLINGMSGIGQNTAVMRTWNACRAAMLSTSPTQQPETLPCNILLEPGLRLGKGIPTSTLIMALSRRAEYERDKKNATPRRNGTYEASV